jgi:hypothetical protein
MKIMKNTAIMMAICSMTLTAHAATVLYSENFDGEGGAGSYDDGTTPEINVGSVGVLQSTGVTQGGNAEDTAWSTNAPATGSRGLRFGGEGGYNWATGDNAATILLAGGFSISFDYTITSDPTDWMGVRVGSGGENSAINAGDVTFGALARANGQMQTFDGAVADGFGTASASATRTAQFFYAFNSWDAGSTVTFTGMIDGNTVATDSFTWDTSNDMKIVFGSAQGGAIIDNIALSTIPEPSAALLGSLAVLGLLRRNRRA